jgi:ribosome modulation factor
MADDPIAAAHKAGRAAMTSEPPHRRAPAACPFEPGTDERAAWLEGFSAALDEQPDVTALKKKIREAQ